MENKHLLELKNREIRELITIKQLFFKVIVSQHNKRRIKIKNLNKSEIEVLGNIHNKFHNPKRRTLTKILKHTIPHYVTNKGNAIKNQPFKNHVIHRY